MKCNTLETPYIFTFCILIDYPIQTDKIWTRSSIIYLRGHRKKFPNYGAFLSMKIVFILVNSEDSCELLLNVVGLYCLSMYPFMVSQYTSG